MNKRVANILADKRFYELGVTISMGRFIPVYWNPKRPLSHPEILSVVSEEFVELIKKIKPRIEVVAGGETGGISLAAATALKAGLPWVYIRKKSKGYSTDVLVEGDYRRGARAILLDDVIANGASKKIFLDNVRGKLVIKDIAVILDDTGGRYPTWMKRQGVYIHSLMRKDERDKYYHQSGFFNDDMYEVAQAYHRDRDNWANNKVLYKKFLKLKQKGF